MTSSTPVQDRSADLGAALRAATARQHREVERSRFVASLIAGHLDGASYLRWLLCLRPIYAALESGLARHAGHPMLASADWSELRRLDALDSDIRDWCALLLVEPPTPVPEATRYAASVNELALDRPGLLLAHAYVRYLGDLSGGQLLQRAVRRMLPEATPGGTAFYEFGDDEQVKRLAAAVRSALVGAGPVALTMGCFDAVIDEAVGAFDRHGRMFAELAPAP